MEKKGKKKVYTTTRDENFTSRPGAISTKTPYGAIDLISQFLISDPRVKIFPDFANQLNQIIHKECIQYPETQPKKVPYSKSTWKTGYRDHLIKFELVILSYKYL